MFTREFRGFAGSRRRVLVDCLRECVRPLSLFVHPGMEISGCSFHLLISASDLLCRAVRGVVLDIGGWERMKDIGFDVGWNWSVVVALGGTLWVCFWAWLLLEGDTEFMKSSTAAMRSCQSDCP